MRFTSTRFSIPVVSMLLAGCGGGLPSIELPFEVRSASEGNQPPVANAGPDQIVTAGDVVVLDGRNSFDPDGLITDWQWGQSGPGPRIDFPPKLFQGTLRVDFVAPDVDTTTDLVVRLEVLDFHDASDVDVVTITIEPRPAPLEKLSISFEQPPGGTFALEFYEVNSDYSPYCVTFENRQPSDTSQGPVYLRTSWANIAVTDLDRVFNPPPETDFNITARFSVPVSSIAAQVSDPLGGVVTMTAFDTNSNRIGSATSEQQPCCSGSSTVSLSDVGEIASVLWQTSSPSTTSPIVDDLEVAFHESCPGAVSGTLN